MRDTNYKVLQVHNYYQIPGGEDTVVANEKKMLEAHGHEVIQYSRNNNELKKFSKVKILLLPFITIFNPRTYKEVKKIIKEQDVDIVHVHNTLSLISPAVYYAALSCKVPVVQTVHNFRLLCPGATFYRDGCICEDCVKHGMRCAVKHGCYRESKVQTLVCVVSTWFHRLTGVYGKLNYICLTEFNKEKLLALKQIKPEQVFIKPNFVINEISIIPYEDRPNQFVFAGRLDKLKGINVLFEAWKQMEDSAPTLIVCGTGPMEDWCKKFIAKNKISNIEMRGFVLNNEVKKLIANSKALILPTQWYEGFPMTIVEAYSVGTPVIGTGMGNVGSVIEEGITGIKIETISSDCIVRAVEKSKSVFGAVSTENILHFYAKHYSQVQNASNFDAIFSRIYVEGGHELTDYFIFVGRLEEIKGVRDLLKAWKIMGNEAPKLIMCGIGPLEDWCKQFIDDNGLHNIELKGFVENKVVKQLIAGSNALILPSQVYEGFPMAIVEAYSVGTPVIGSDLGNTGSLIKSGITGLKYDHKNVESMVDAVKQMEEHPFRCDLNIFKQFSVEKNNCVLESIYLSAMSK